MPVIRTKKDKDNPYMLADKGFYWDLRLSNRGRGLLGTVLSLPPNWSYSVRGLASICYDGEDSIRTTLKELEKLGYLVRKRTRSRNGQLGKVEYTFFERSLLTIRDRDVPQQVTPDMASPIAGAEPQLINNILINNDINNPSIYRDREIDRDMCMCMVRANIDYPSLAVRNPHNVDQINEMVAIMADVMMMPDNAEITVGGNQLSAGVVKSQLQRLRSNHIEYVLDSMSGSAAPIRNIHGYLLTALYRAPLTLHNHYAAQVACDDMTAAEGDITS